MRIRNAAVIAAVPLAVAACSKVPSTSSAGGGTSPSSPSSSADPLASLTADQIAAKAFADLKAASSVHVAGTFIESGSTMSISLTLAKSRCAGTLSEHGQGSFRIIMIGKSIWIKPDSKFWTSAGGASGAALSLVEGKWIKPSSKTSGLGAFGDLCSPTLLAGQMSDSFGMVKGKTTTIHGRTALELTQGGDTTVGYVSESASPEILRLAQAGQEQLDFSNYNAPVTMTRPPASETLDGSELGF